MTRSSARIRDHPLYRIDENCFRTMFPDLSDAAIAEMLNDSGDEGDDSDEIDLDCCNKENAEYSNVTAVNQTEEQAKNRLWRVQPVIDVVRNRYEYLQLPRDAGDYSIDEQIIPFKVPTHWISNINKSLTFLILLVISRRFGSGTLGASYSLKLATAPKCLLPTTTTLNWINVERLDTAGVAGIIIIFER
ncbi:unnamed protein product [Arctia plantaginis]|uniref:PiggyBac transposable element-derived protein domain-containing protein n=1 Tax=Arctia plantaginis TaxID=874455 RepID=A0A8S1BR36_ARCPL|nr:unnamed protein product [Arctia plantaginis]